MVVRPPETMYDGFEQIIHQGLADYANSLTPDRKQAVKEEIDRINAMTFVQRRFHMHSKEFEQSFTAAELELLRYHFPNAAK